MAKARGREWNDPSFPLPALAAPTSAPGASFPMRHRPLNRALRALRSTPRTRRLRPERALIKVRAECCEVRAAIIRSHHPERPEGGHSQPASRKSPFEFFLGRPPIGSIALNI